jgi:GTP-dependent phosphoenolpyruvate carboxykinase
LVGADHIHDSQLGELLSVKPEEWKKELEGQAKFFDTLEPDMPQRLRAEREKIAKRFEAL